MFKTELPPCNDVDGGFHWVMAFSVVFSILTVVSTAFNSNKFDESFANGIVKAVVDTNYADTSEEAFAKCEERIRLVNKFHRKLKASKKRFTRFRMQLWNFTKMSLGNWDHAVVAQYQVCENFSKKLENSSASRPRNSLLLSCAKRSKCPPTVFGLRAVLTFLREPPVVRAVVDENYADTSDEALKCQENAESNEMALRKM